jgi:MYXO-CTERM domain-containing protein
MTLCWTVTRPIVAAVQNAMHRAPRPRIFHTVGHAEHVTRHHTWAIVKAAATITSIVCVGGPLVPYLIPSVPAAVAPGAPGGDVDSGPDTPFGGAPEGSEVGGLVPFLIPTGAGFIPGSGFVPGGGLTPGGGGSFVTPPVTEVNRPPKPVVMPEPGSAAVLGVAVLALLGARRRKV